jgi:hypothetical protein
MTHPEALDRLVDAYHRMVERATVRMDEIDQAEREAFPYIRESIEHAAARAVELGELTREEAHQIADYVKRDLADAGHYLASTGRDLGAWLRFDISLIEERILEWFGKAADRTRLQMLELELELERASHYTAGEIAGPGTLACDACDTPVHFHRARPIPHCAHCGGARYRRESHGTPGR